MSSVVVELIAVCLSFIYGAYMGWNELKQKKPFAIFFTFLCLFFIGWMIINKYKDSANDKKDVIDNTKKTAGEVIDTVCKNDNRNSSKLKSNIDSGTNKISNELKEYNYPEIEIVDDYRYPSINSFGGDNEGYGNKDDDSMIASFSFRTINKEDAYNLSFRFFYLYRNNGKLKIYYKSVSAKPEIKSLNKEVKQKTFRFRIRNEIKSDSLYLCFSINYFDKNKTNSHSFNCFLSNYKLNATHLYPLVGNEINELKSFVDRINNK